MTHHNHEADLMTNEQLRQLAIEVLQVATSAAQVVISGYRKVDKIQHKQAAELVTAYDYDSEQVIRAGLVNIDSSICIVAEESGGQPRGERVWYVDPIDGTTNFAHGHPFWAISIGLAIGGRPALGVVIAPALDIVWMGWGRVNAFRNRQPCHVSATSHLSDSLLATGFPYDRATSKQNNFNAFQALQRQVIGVRRCGSAAIDLCLVADGTYDGYWEKKLRAWDIAAGIAIVTAAGGRATSMDGQRVDLQRADVIATNELIHEQLQKQLSLAPDES